MRKILCIAPYQYIPYFSGGQKYIAEFTRHLSKRTALTVISTGDNKPGKDEAYTFLPLLGQHRTRYIDIGLVWQLHSLIKKNKYDAIIWEHPYYGWLAMILQWLTGICTVIHTHNIEYQRFRSMGKWWWSILGVYEKWTLRNADKIFCITEEDRQVMMNEFGIHRENTCLVTAGIDNLSDYQEKTSYQLSIKQRYGINEETRLFLFSGLLSYKPNEDAVLFIRDKLVPKLETENPFPFKIIICGKGMNPIYTNETDPKNHRIIYTGFVEDISEYIKAADLFLNPVVTGGGIKTKVIESIGFNTTVISTTSGATGVQKEVCGNKLVIVPDGDVEIFTKAIVEFADDHSETPPSYYQYYKWENIIEQAIQSLPDQST